MGGHGQQSTRSQAPRVRISAQCRATGEASQRPGQRADLQAAFNRRYACLIESVDDQGSFGERRALIELRDSEMRGRFRSG